MMPLFRIHNVPKRSSSNQFTDRERLGGSYILRCCEMDLTLWPIFVVFVFFYKMQKRHANVEASECIDFTLLSATSAYITRSSATTEKQRVSCPHAGGLGPPAHSPTPLATRMRMVESEIHNTCTSSVPSTKRTLRWIGHSRSFKVILIGAGMNPERCVVVMCN